MSPDLIIDGKRILDFPSFVAEFNRAFLLQYPGVAWDGDSFLDLDDFLEVPAGRFTIRWINSAVSRSHLGHEQMADFQKRGLANCLDLFPAVTLLHDDYRERIELAETNCGPTLFDYLVEQLSYPEKCDVVLE